MQVGFIGLGIMGAGMAANLQKAGCQLVVHDIRQDSATPHLKAGATWADSPKWVAAQSNVIFTSLPGPPEVEAVALGPNGLIESMQKGSAWFDLTTNSPTLVRRLHKLFSERALHLLDAPVSGGPQGAKSGRLAIWVGGERRSLVLTNKGSTPSATQHATLAQSAPARWPSSCTTAPATASKWFWQRSSRWASRPASSRLPYGKPCAPAPAGASAPSTASMTGFSQTSTTLRALP